MPAQHSLHVALTAELCDLVARLVASGRYQSSSEVVRAALRLLEHAEASTSLAQCRPSVDRAGDANEQLAG